MTEFPNLPDQFSSFDLTPEQFHDPIRKNQLLADATGRLLFSCADITASEDIISIINANPFLMDYDVIVFGDRLLEGVQDAFSLYSHPTMRIFSLVFSKKILATTGCFNELLTAGDLYEFLIRCLRGGFSVFGINASDENAYLGFDEAHIRNYARSVAFALYTDYELPIIRNNFSALAQQISQAFRQYLADTVFMDWFRQFLHHPKEAELLSRNTAPFFILINQTGTCYGLLTQFAEQLTASLLSLGQAVITSDHRLGSYQNAIDLSSRTLKGYIAFQSPELTSKGNPLIRQSSTPKYQFWMDSPVFFDKVFDGLDDTYHILCADAHYADYLQRVKGLRQAIFFPPAGIASNNAPSKLSPQKQRSLDLVFIGTYHPVPEDLSFDSSVEDSLFSFFLSHPEYDFENGLREFCKTAAVSDPDPSFDNMLIRMRPVFKRVIHYFRHLVINRILQAEIPVHVYGDSWQAYHGEHTDLLHIHPALSPSEAEQVLRDAKISLNIMYWHKQGMTERIAGSMLQGAVCLSDETTYLREHFTNGKDIALYSLTDLQMLPEMINQLLADDVQRQRLADQAYDNAATHHAWPV